MPCNDVARGQVSLANLQPGPLANPPGTLTSFPYLILPVELFGLSKTVNPIPAATPKADLYQARWNGSATAT